MFHHLPPTGTPIRLRDITAATKAETSADLEARLRQRLGVTHVALVNSGRSAQTLILQGMAALAGSGKTEVIIPAWTCYSVPASIVRAGLRVRPVEIDPTTLDYDYAALNKEDTSHVLAIMGCNLFGITTDWTRLLPWGNERSLFVIDDAAQALGSSVDGKPSGSFGQAGLLSFDRGKNLPAWSGGAILTSHEGLHTEISKLLSRLPQGGSSAMTKAKLAAYSVLLPPSRFWLPANMPFLGLGETDYYPNFDMTSLSSFQESLAVLLLERLDQLNLARQKTAQKLIHALAGIATLQFPGKSRTPIYLRLPVLAESRHQRDLLVSRLRASGLGAAVMYPEIVPDIPGLPTDSVATGGDYRRAREVAARLFTLPTHAFVRDSDISRMANLLRTV